MRSSILAALAATMLALALALPVTADTQRPMHGQFTGSGVAADQRCPGALTLGFAIAGVATHLGNFSGSGTNCTEFTLATDAVAIWDGIITIEAADGSTLTLQYTGGQGAPTAGTAEFSHADTVIGGTGRFAAAEGELTVTGQIDFASLTVTGTISGWLSY
jgi:hypothetical protein